MTRPAPSLARALRYGAITLLLLASCTPAGREKWHKTWDRRPPRQLLDVALHDKNADERRKAVEALADSRSVTEDWVVKAFDTISRSDANAMVRAAAVRGLGKSAFATCVPTLVKLLNSADGPIPDCLPAPSPVRWEAALVLEQLSKAGRIAAADRDSVLKALLARADKESDRNVRLTIVATLQYYPDRRALPVLINVMRTRDFGLQLRTETTLNHLTGQSHDQDPDAWDRWLSQTPDPLAHPATQPARKSWWQRGR